MSIDTMHSSEKWEPPGILRFGVGFGLGVLVIPAALVVGFNTGATMGWAALIALTLAAALAGGRITVSRALGTLTGMATFVGVALLVLAPLFMGDW